MRLVLGLPRPSHCVGTGAPWVSLPGPTSAHSDAQGGWHREQNANPVCAVGASPVVSWNLLITSSSFGMLSAVVVPKTVLLFPFSASAVSWQEPSALLVVELWLLSQQPPSRLVSPAASFAAIALASSGASYC